MPALVIRELTADEINTASGGAALIVGVIVGLATCVALGITLGNCVVDGLGLESV
jgi:hypothetical protein